MLKIKRIRFGCKNNPFYRIVAIDHRRVYSKEMILLGFDDPIKKQIKFNIEKIQFLLSRGAKITKKLYFKMKSIHDFGEKNYS